MVRVGYVLQFSSNVSSVFLLSLVWYGNLNKEIASSDSEKQPLYSDVHFSHFSLGNSKV